jgi:2-iminobutanoate/2-iminopropanoate deaminase
MRELEQIFEVYPSDPTCLIPLGICINGVIIGQGLSALGYKTGRTEGDLETQLQTCLARLRELVERGGASLENVGRVVCHVPAPEQRESAYLAWEELFPGDQHRPAFKVLTGDLPGGGLVRFDVLAVRDASPHRIDIKGVPARDPTVVMGDWMFTSRLHGISPATGRVVIGLANQLNQALSNAESMVQQAGGTRSDISQVNVFARDDASLARARAVFDSLFESESTRPTFNGLKSWVRADSDVMVEVTYRTGGQAQPFQELFLDRRASNAADGFRLGDLIFAPALSGHGLDTEGQIRSALGKMDDLLKLGGSNIGEVARVTFYMRDLSERTTLNKVWEEWFPEPDDRPPHTYLPAALPPDQAVAVQVMALAGASRRVLYVEGVQHGDPMSLGSVTGVLLTSSRIFGAGGSEASEGLEPHTERCLANASALLDDAGAAWRNVRQIVAYGSSSTYRQTVERLVAEKLGAADLPRLDFLETDLGRGNLLPRLQLLAVV